MQPPADTSRTRGPATNLQPRPLARVLADLAACGMQPMLRSAIDGIGAGGISLRLDIRPLLADPVRMAAEFERVRALLLRRVPVNLALTDGGVQAPRRVEQLLRRLQRAVSPGCIDLRLLGLAVPATEMPLPAFVLMSKVLFGNGPRYAILGECHLQQARGGGAANADAAWTVLYKERARRWRLQPVYGGTARTRCPLLSDEAGTTVVEPGGLLAPAGSAWLALTFNVCRFASRSGQLRRTALFASLRRGLRAADELLDRLAWPDTAQRQDAHDNRRLAVCIDGLAELLLLRGADSGSFASLQQLDRLLASIHDCLWDTSRALARERGLLPALAARDPSRAVADAAHRHSWRQRWQEALATAAVRHRNLLVLSPYKLLPHPGADARNSLDLLPLLVHADACSFAPGANFPDWSINDFRLFHRRAWTVLRRRSGADFVAAGV